MHSYRNGREYIECSAEDCTVMTSSKHGLCISHYKQRWYLNSVGRDELLPIRTSQDRWVHKKYGYILIKIKGELVYEHRVLAEKALGRPLPKGAVIHHMNGPADNHRFGDLVICPDQAYHILLHKRMEELGYGKNS
jgi:hypothetical protein